MSLSSLTKQSTGSDALLAVTIGRRIRAARLARGMSQAELGDPLTRAYVCQVESGRTLPSIPALLHLADRLGVDSCLLLASPGGDQGLYTPAHGHAHPLDRTPPG